VLTLRELNRATLARQLLLERVQLDVPTKLAKAARAELEREAELALAALEPAASRFEVEYVP
jgi:hypothetical protein